MAKNVGRNDAILRMVLGGFFLLAGFLLPVGIPMALILILAGLALIVSSFFQICFLYRAFGINTSPKPSAKTSDDVPLGPVGDDR